jgi:hypothetical protein
MTPKDIDHYQRQALFEMVRKAKAEADEAEVRLDIAKLDRERATVVNEAVKKLAKQPFPMSLVQAITKQANAIGRTPEYEQWKADLEAQARRHYGFPPTGKDKP